MGFQKTVLIVALVILTLAIIVMATVISNNESKKKWPPEVATCPPFYKVHGENGIISCKLDASDAIGNGDSNCQTKQMTVAGDNSKFISDQDKCNWANGCGVHWDGITTSDCSTRDATTTLVNNIKKN